jgi:hypothetical protein
MGPRPNQNTNQTSQVNPFQVDRAVHAKHPGEKCAWGAEQKTGWKEKDECWGQKVSGLWAGQALDPLNKDIVLIMKLKPVGSLWAKE